MNEGSEGDLIRLKREVSLFDAIIINLGAIIGAGIFVIIGIAAGKAGSALPVSIVISAIVAIFTGLSFSEIAMHVSKEGGVYEYAKESLSPAFGFVGGIMWIFGNIVAVAAVSISLVSYINAAIGIHLPEAYTSFAVIIGFAVLNAYGIKHSAKTLAIMVLINVSILIIFVITSLFFFKVGNFSGMLHGSQAGILSGAAIIFFAFTGFSRITTIGDEVKDPEHTVPKAIIISIVISALIYIAVAAAALGLVPPGYLANSSAPLSDAIMHATHLWILATIVAIGGIFATGGVVLTGILGVSRVLFAMGRDRELPSQMSKLDRFSTPVNAIIVAAVFSIAFVAFVSFESIVEASNALILLAYATIDVSAINISRKFTGKKKGLLYSRYFSAIPIMGLLSIAFTVVYLGITSIGIALGIMLVAIAYYAVKVTLENAGYIRKRIAVIPSHSVVRLFGKSRYRE